MLKQLVTWFGFLLFVIPLSFPSPLVVASLLDDCCCRIAFLVSWLYHPFFIFLFVGLLSYSVLGISVFLGCLLCHRRSPPPFPLSPSPSSDKSGPPCVISYSSSSSSSADYRLRISGSPSSFIVVFVTGVLPSGLHSFSSDLFSLASLSADQGHRFKGSSGVFLRATCFAVTSVQTRLSFLLGGGKEV